MSFSPPQSSTRIATGSPPIASTMRAVGLRLGVLVRHRLTVHEQELGSQQTDPERARLGDQRQFERQFQIGLQLDRLAVQRLGRQAAQLGEALPLAGEGGDRPPRRGQGLRRRDSAPRCRQSRPPPTMSPGRMACARPAAPSTAGTPSARSMTEVWPSAPPSSVATPASRDGSSSAASDGRSDFADQHGALRAGRRSCGTASASDCAPAGGRSRAPPRRAASGWHGPPPACPVRPAPGSPRRSPPTLRPRRLGRDQRLLDPPPHGLDHARWSPACGYRLRSAVSSSTWVSCGSTASRLRSLPSCLRDWATAASNRAPSAPQSAAWILCRVISGVGSEARNTGPIATPAETGMPPKRRSGRVWSGRARREPLVLRQRRASLVHRSRTRPARRGLRAPPWRPSPRRAAR